MSESQSNLESAVSALRAEINLLRLEVAEGKDVTTHPNTASEWYPSQFASTFGIPRTIAFGSTFDALVVTVTAGNVYFKGVSKAIGSWPAGGAVTISATTHAWLDISLTDGTVTWNTGASDPGDGDYDTEIWRIFVATVAGGVITELLECQHGDIHCMGNA